MIELLCAGPALFTFENRRYKGQAKEGNMHIPVNAPSSIPETVRYGPFHSPSVAPAVKSGCRICNVAWSSAGTQGVVNTGPGRCGVATVRCNSWPWCTSTAAWHQEDTQCRCRDRLARRGTQQTGTQQHKGAQSSGAYWALRSVWLAVAPRDDGRRPAVRLAVVEVRDRTSHHRAATCERFAAQFWRGQVSC